MSCHHRSAWYHAAKGYVCTYMSCHQRSAWHGIRIWITDLRRSRHQQVFRPSPNLLRAHHSARRPWPAIRHPYGYGHPISMRLLHSLIGQFGLPCRHPTTTACKKKPCLYVYRYSIIIDLIVQSQQLFDWPQLHRSASVSHGLCRYMKQYIQAIKCSQFVSLLIFSSARHPLHSRIVGTTTT